MTRNLPLSLPSVRHLLLALLALGLVFRMVAGCEAMAAIASVTSAQQMQCADMPAKPDKLVKTDIAACAVCAALPDTATATIEAVGFDRPKHDPAHFARLAGLNGGPAPPPPRIV